MRLWLSKNSEVPIREQLATQIMLGIVSGDFKPGQKLPSTRELARRLDIHANTVSAAYSDLDQRGWVEFRKGSGIYVRVFDSGTRLDSELELDQMISVFLRVAREKGYSLRDIHSRVRYWMDFQPPDHFLVIDPVDEMREILLAEIEDAVGFPVEGARPADCSNVALLTGAAPVAFYGQAETVRAALPPDTNCLLIHSRSVPESLQGEHRPPIDSLITVVSCWEDFLKWARAVLVAAGVDSDALSLRNTKDEDWQKGLSSSGIVITESLTARRLPKGCKARVFRIIADASIEELRRLKEYLTKPAS